MGYELIINYSMAVCMWVSSEYNVNYTFTE